jgi:DNA-binding CsgD family transcriptional regulator
LSKRDRLVKATAGLGDVVLDPAAWPRVMDDICGAMGSTGAALLQSDVRTGDLPHTASLGELVGNYFKDGWHERDVRGQRGIPRILAGETVFMDQELFMPDELRRMSYYNDFIIPNRFQWFAAVGFWAGNALWALSIQRTPREGPFGTDDKRVLAQISGRLTEAATLSTLVSRSVLTATTNGLNLVGQPALLLDHFGCVLDRNASADRMFDDEIRICNRRLWVSDASARAALDQFIDRLRTTPDDSALPIAPITARRAGKFPLIIRVLPIEAAARSPFLGARALLMLTSLGKRIVSNSKLVAGAFNLTEAEAQIAVLVGSGLTPKDAADQLGVSRETARSQLKAVFHKTGVNRQAELVALLASFRDPEDMIFTRLGDAGTEGGC